ncbi:uncharacterized protein [Antedon mediterranea]|uniref:uncharacterized protein n=1 Tax=Antedon mediterranea TaxID=105859 RepID=UPI003AF9A20C
MEYICPRGYYCPEGTLGPQDNGCPGGNYYNGLGAVKETDCITCPAGYYCPEGSAEGLLCHKGYYCPAGTENDQDNPCPGGTFTEEEGATSQDFCKDCPAGYYCTSGTDTPLPCLQGTYNPSIGQNALTDCRNCTAGSACTRTGLVEPDSVCEPGYYCPEGLDDPFTYPCPAGTYTDYHNLTASFQCDPCPVQFACPIGTGGVNQAPEECAPGYYCSLSTQHRTQHPCPAGSYSNKTNLGAVSECYECPRGYYCIEASTEPVLECVTGHYCPAGTQYSTQYPCAAGSYSNEVGNTRWEQCVTCTKGSYCLEGASLPTACPSGTYRDELNGEELNDCTTCTAGHYCPGTGNTEPIECEKASYSDTGAPECSDCEAGYYCDSKTTTRDNMYANKICPAGMFCDYNRTSAPNLENDACPVGYYCLSGDLDPFPRPCPNGTYSDVEGLVEESDCQDCPAGKWCSPPGLSEPAGDCPGGHYCPVGTADPYENPCPVGFYLNASAGEDSLGCTICISGYYCSSKGLAWPIDCPQGYFCVSGSTFPQECPAGTYGNTTNLRRSDDCSPCPGGYYCDGVGNTEPTDLCDPGFYCREKAYTSAPPDGLTGGLCPAGGYCPAGSAWPANCPYGTYSNSSGSKTPDDCIDCDPGYYCAGDNNPEPTGPCKAGYYCTGGAGTAIQFSTPIGHYSLSGAYKPEPCPRGEYQTAANSEECLTCLQGYYCNGTGTSEQVICDIGHYCPPESVLPTPCPLGTFREITGGQDLDACDYCTPGKFCGSTGLSAVSGDCAAGHYCILGANTSHPLENATDAGGLCPEGYYCPAGTADPFHYPCENGTYSNRTGLEELEDCTDCPPGEVCNGEALYGPNGICAPGYFCLGKAKSQYPTDGSTGDICPIGFYCPEGSPAPKRCEGGYFTNITGQSSCFDCPERRYCPDGERLLECPRGHYCPVNTGGNESIPCPQGTYNPALGLAREDECLPCDGGHYCQGIGIVEFDGSSGDDFGVCEPRYYCLQGVNVSNPEEGTYSGDGGPCPQGFYCPEETTYPKSCPNGTYSDLLRLQDESECESCDPGYYCGTVNLTQPQGQCDSGFFCTSGAIYPNPTGGDSTGGPCPTKHYCPNGTAVPLGCPVGTYNNLEQQSECFTCPAGYYCPESISDFSLYRCPAGYYCPNGTTHMYEYPCPKGYYREDDFGMSLSDCTPCDPGKYCGTEGNTTYTDDCDPGYFCIRAAYTATPDDWGNYTDGDCLCPANITGGRCQPGYYCPRGSSEPQECTEGDYCETHGLSDVTAPCKEGHYCISKASRIDPEDGITGDVCPPGRYCNAGTGVNPPKCPRGKYSSASGLTDIDQCSNCTAGFYCEDEGLTTVTDPCDPGYYCPTGQQSSNPFHCETGYYCPEGSPDQVPCQSGSYQDEIAQSTCKICLSGYYCDVADAPIDDYTMYPCPQGYYCPNGTEFNTQFSCPNGTYGSQQQLEDDGECTECPPGKYCFGTGNTDTTDDCEAGFWCKGRASTSVPTDGVTGQECPEGKFCVAGTPAPENCPVGTWSDSVGLQNVSLCQACTEGYYCNGTGLTSPSGPCDPGFYCVSNAVSATPNDTVTGGPCTKGHYCPGATPSPIPCEAGTFMTETHADECNICYAGFYCVTGYEPERCPAGFYCPAGTGYDWQPCPTGTFSTNDGLSNETQCTQCSAGKYCAETNATMVTGKCDPGYYCVEGSDTPTPEVNFKGTAGLCYEGHYCPIATSTPSPCPRGTFSNITKLTNDSECTDCLYGQYCETEGLVYPTGDCYAGFYCLRGAKDPNNPIVDETSGPCPVGYYCPNGTSYPLACLPGTYNPSIGQSECLECEPGYWCPENSTDYQDTPCPTGHYCPAGTPSSDQYPCPKGYYNDYEGQQTLDDCKPCPPGKFCETSGLSSDSGSCDAGWYCVRGAWSRTPIDLGDSNSTSSCFCASNSTGGQCMPGQFCPEGSSEPTPCTRGYYCDAFGLANETDECDPGYYCTLGASVSDPVDNVTGNECPEGHYCPRGTYDPIQCPAGYFSNTTRNDEIGDCLDCLPGYYCEGSGLTKPTAICDAGFYCPGGQNTSRPAEYTCSPGHYCPESSPQERTCELGLYQDEWGQEECKICPEGYYCDSTLQNDTFCSHGVQNPQTCPEGYYCPNGTKFDQEFGCPLGTYSDDIKLKDFTECTQCTGGMYCDELGLPAPKGQCLAGYYCKLGSSSPTPEDGVTGDICPEGAFCPMGSNKTYLCPPGTYNPTTGLESVDQCLGCEAGQFCPEYGMNMTAGDCDERFYCSGNASSPAPTDGQTGDECPIGHYCPSGSPVPLPCDPGTYTDTTTNHECLPCTPGHYCITGSNPEDCPAGFYCPEGTGHVWEACPPGTFSSMTGLANVTQCTQCLPGYFCDSFNATVTSGFCDPGFYCLLGSDSQQPGDSSTGDAGVCPTGYYCGFGTGEPDPCPASTFSNVTGITAEQYCQQCLEGMYCDTPGLAYPKGLCEEGFYCQLGSNNSNPSTVTSAGGPCPPGTYCMSGSSEPTDCLPGYYNPVYMQSDCLNCPEGSYCDDGCITPDICPKGHFCPNNTGFATQFPCNNGTFNNRTGGSSVDSCQLCIAGHYCPYKGMIEPEGLCDEGWYCTLGAWKARPTTLGNDTDLGCHCPAESTGGRCLAGTYCPAGSDQPIPCDPGYYCQFDELANVSGPCQAGFYCSGSTILPNPVNDTTGDICPQGYYCPEGSSGPEACSPGTYSNTFENHNITDCIPCTAGKYCTGWGRVEPNDYCDEGWFCPEGSTAAQPPGNECLAGHQCPVGSPDQSACLSGSYQPFTGQGECYDCPAGSYCDQNEAIEELQSGMLAETHGVVTPKDCPAGFYCPNGTETARQYPCPIGTYSNTTNLENITECRACPQGFYCEAENITTPTEQCSPGYYCVLGANTPTPEPTDETGGPCPQGTYCESGSSWPSPCPKGTFGRSDKLGSEGNCTECYPGQFCMETSLTAPNGSCLAGFYCTIRAIDPNPYNKSYGAVCPVGHYCPEASPYPTACLAGTYQPNEMMTNESACFDCTPGKYCNNSGLEIESGLCYEGFYCTLGASNPTPQDNITGNICPKGHFCELGSPAPEPCPNGTFMNHTMGEQCYDCPAGYYCVNRDRADPCPPGYYCPPKTGADLRMCPSGTYNPREGIYEEDQCLECDPGSYCREPGQANVTGNCSAGYYCEWGVDVDKPTGNHTGVGGICPPGHYCPEGSAIPLGCPAGHYTDIENQPLCTSCPAGYYCLQNSTSFSENVCPAGYYCPLETTHPYEYPCPKGSFNPVNNSDEIEDCLACLPGMYCQFDGQDAPSGNCSAGWYCTGGSYQEMPLTTANATDLSECTCPLANYTGGKCWPGTYCPSGSPYPVSCDEGYYCKEYGRPEPNDQCDAGYYCDGGASEPDPDDRVCPEGTYCEVGSATPTHCPSGTFANTSGNIQPEDCLSCTPGKFCSGPGNVIPDNDCDPGYYCPGGQSSASPAEYNCTIGHFCDGGNDQPEPCEPGYYQDEIGTAVCKECPAGYYCDPVEAAAYYGVVSHGVVTPTDCPVGYYCPNGTESKHQYPCLEGYYSNSTNLHNHEQCLPCPGGKYCDGKGLTVYADECDAGYVCVSASNNSQPTDSITGYECRPGYYCPKGSDQGTKCPVGTFSNNYGLENVTECEDCRPGSHCQTEGLTEPTGECYPGFYCTLAAINPNPNAQVYGDVCPTGSYCPNGTYDPFLCPVGSYNPSTGRDDPDDCLPCEGGKYCDTQGQSNYTVT